MNGLLDKYNPPPLCLANYYIKWSAVTVLMYLLMRFVWHRNIGRLEFTGIIAGLVIGTLWSFVILIRAYGLAKKGIFVSAYKKNRNKTLFLIWLIIEISIPLIVGYCVLRIAAYKINFNFSNAIWSLIFSLFFAFFLVSGIGYHFLEWLFGKKFYDRPNE